MLLFGKTWLASAVTACGLAGGCATAIPDRVQLPAAKTMTRDQLVISSDFNLPRQHRLVDELVAQRGEVAAKLRLPTSDEPIYVYLFDAPQRYQQYLQRHYPHLPDRRAFFVETDTQLTVLAHWGDNVADDLRHEVAHGYLHAVVPNVPLWLDEGLAEYFEVPRGRGGLNEPHVERLCESLAAGTWRPFLPRLEHLQSVGEMNQLDYAEAWAWVHWLLETTPSRSDLLRGYLNHLRTATKTEPLTAELLRREPMAEVALAEYLQGLRAK